MIPRLSNGVFPSKLSRQLLFCSTFRWNSTHARSTLVVNGSSAPSPSPAMQGIPPPLKGIRIIDLTRVLAAPTATLLLADLGADVIKVEEVGKGDDTRSWHPPCAPLKPDQPPGTSHLPPESAYFLSVNRNKRSITVNFKEPEGLKIMQDLIKGADVLVENFVTGKLGKMGLGWEDCKKINPRLIYASITGYGQTGPYAEQAGYDVIIEAEAGLMHITGEPDGLPVKVGVAVTDIACGLYAHGAIMAALISRQQTGQGAFIDCNLFDSQVAGLANIASNYLVAGMEASRLGTAHPSIVPYQVFKCSDSYLMIGAANNRQFGILVTQILDLPELATNQKFIAPSDRVKNRVELIEILENRLMEETREYWLKKFNGKGVPFGPINNIRQTFEHPQAVARDLVTEVDHPRIGKFKMVAPAVQYNGKRMPVTRPPPWHSQHTQEVLKEIGYTDEQMDVLKKKGVI